MRREPGEAGMPIARTPFTIGPAIEKSCGEMLRDDFPRRKQIICKAVVGLLEFEK